MGDVFKEQLVKAVPSSQDNLKKGLVVVGAAIISVAALFLGGTFFGPLIVVAVVWGGMYLTALFKKEFEYSLTNHEIDVDVIYNKQRRKRLLTVDIKQSNVMASIKDEKYQHEIERGQKIIDASDGKQTKDTYAIVFGKDGETVRLLITPNEEMLNLIHKQAPNKVHKMRY